MMFAFWPVKNFCTLKPKRNFQEWKYRQLPFQRIFCFDFVITVSPATRCCFRKSIMLEKIWNVISLWHFLRFGLKMFVHWRQNETCRNENIDNYLSREYFVLILCELCCQRHLVLCNDLYRQISLAQPDRLVLAFFWRETLFSIPDLAMSATSAWLRNCGSNLF